MRRVAALWCVLALVVLGVASAAAHNKSLSFSTWIWDGKYLNVTFTTPMRDVTLLPEMATNPDLSSTLAAHVNRHLRLRQVDTPCKLDTPFVGNTARVGYTQVTGRFACFSETAALQIENHAFFNLARSHVHFARLATAEQSIANAREILFTATQRQHLIQPNTHGLITHATSLGDTMGSYFKLGLTHILTGFDHLAFLFCLLLLARTRRQAIWLVTGFTAGHSLTLALAALGWVTPNAAVVEALIGASIALVAAETILARNQLMARTGMVTAGVLFIASGIVIFTGSALPLGAWAGLVLFFLCYGLLIQTPQDAQNYAPIMTLAFGLIHGFGFAGLLSDIGLPSQHLLTGLFSFNIGVEFGQLIVLIPAFIFAPILAEELPKLPVRWRDITASALTALGLYLFVTRVFI